MQLEHYLQHRHKLGRIQMKWQISIDQVAMHSQQVCVEELKLQCHIDTTIEITFSIHSIYITGANNKYSLIPFIFFCFSLLDIFFLENVLKTFFLLQCMEDTFCSLSISSKILCVKGINFHRHYYSYQLGVSLDMYNMNPSVKRSGM